MSSPLLTKLEGEAELMLALRHPNCCSILGVCETPPCLVTGACVRGLTQLLTAPPTGHAPARLCCCPSCRVLQQGGKPASASFSQPPA